MTWRLEQHQEDAATFHARRVSAPAERSVWGCDVTRPALVLGSTQADDVADAAACHRVGVDVVRRRSGGGAVLVEPGQLLWVDVIVPRGDPLWQDDVGRAFHWLGDTWSQALAALGVQADPYKGPLSSTRWSKLVCFAGLGPGELTLAGGQKVVGISQRRTRDAARFQCAALLRWDPDRLVSLLALSDDDRATARADLVSAAAGLPVEPAPLLAAFLHHLP